MLRQEINLYTPFAIKRPAAHFLSWTRLWRYFLASTIFFTLLYIVSLFNLYYISRENTQLQTSITQLQTKFNALKKSYPSLFFSPNVELSIDSLQKELDQQKQLLGSLEMVTTFSQNLITFSTEIVPNVWLTKIEIANNGNVISLQGKSLDMGTLQTFISHMTQYKFFAQFVFNVGNISKIQHAKDGGNLSFELNMSKPAA